MGLKRKILDGFLPVSPWKFFKLVKYLKLVQKKDVEEINRLQSFFFHDDFTYYVGGNGRISGICHGWPEYRDKIILAEVGTPGEIVSLSTSRNSICLVTNLTGERNGKALDLQVAFLFRYIGNKLVEGRSIPFDERAWDLFWE